MKKKVIIFIILIIIAIICVMFFLSTSTKNKLKRSGEQWAPSIEELKPYGIYVPGKSIVEAKVSFFSGNYLLIYYGDPSPFFITIYFHKSPTDAKEHFLKEKVTLARMLDSINVENNDFLIGNLLNKGGKKNYLIWSLMEDKVVLISAASESILWETEKDAVQNLQNFYEHFRIKLLK